MKPSTAIIDMKMPSLNEYTSECRRNKYAGARMKREIQEQITWYLTKLPHYDKKVKIDFYWEEKNGKRDIDNFSFGKKFILDALVEVGVLSDDNRKCVGCFVDHFPEPNGEKTFVKIKITEMECLTPRS